VVVGDKSESMQETNDGSTYIVFALRRKSRHENVSEFIRDRDRVIVQIAHGRTPPRCDIVSKDDERVGALVVLDEENRLRNISNLTDYRR
jgi:hypothetical protein